jgi:membrane-associated phospholipid phosphatase
MAEKEPLNKVLKKAANGKEEREKIAGGKKKISMSVFAYIVSTIIFVFGVVICSIDNNDEKITNFFYSAAQANQTGFLYQLGAFFQYNFYEANFWTSGDVGQIFSLFLIVVAVILLIVSLVQINKEQKLAKAENRVPGITPYGKYFKYTVLVLIVAIAFVEGLTDLVKLLWGRVGASTVLDNKGTFTPWWLPLGPVNGLGSFYSGDVAMAALTITLALSFIGSNKKVLAPLCAAGAIAYVILTGIGRMASGAHWFSDVLFGGWVIYTFSMITYYWILDIPGLERIYMHQIVNVPYTQGYNLMVEAKALLKENPDEAMAKVSAGLEKLGQARAKIEEEAKFGRDYSALKVRVEDLLSRFDLLAQEYQSSKDDMDAYFVKWSYVF